MKSKKLDLPEPRRIGSPKNQMKPKDYANYRRSKSSTPIRVASKD